MDNQGKEGSFRSIFIIMGISLLIAFFWDSMKFIKDSVSFFLNPTAGALLNWNITLGMILIVLCIAIVTTLIQKYMTDQKTLREIKKEQKILQAELKKYKEHPEKLMELQKKQFEMIPRMMKISLRGTTYTAIPLILFFRWFMDYFNALEDFKFFGFFSWFWFYLIFSMVFSSVLRKILKVV